MSCGHGPGYPYCPDNMETRADMPPTRVVMDSPYGRQTKLHSTASVVNGTEGTLIREMPDGGWLIDWDGVGEWETPAHWFHRKAG